MTTQIVLPDADKEVGDPNPPGDMNAVITALNAMQATQWVYPTGDETGATDAANIMAAYDALGATGGVIWLAPGVFYVEAGQVVIPTAQVKIKGVLRWATKIIGVGSGDVIRMYNGAGSSSGLWGGGVEDVVLDGSDATGAMNLLHIGDGEQYELNVAVQNITEASSWGVLLDNTIWWTEKLHGTIFARNCTNHVGFNVSTPATTVAAGSNGGEISTIASWSNPSAGVLDVASIPAGWPTAGTVHVAASGSTTAVVTYTGVSGNSLTGCAYISGSATGTVSTGGAVTLATATNSFGYLDLTCYIYVQSGQDGVVVQNGAYPYHGRLTIKGNVAGTDANAVLRVTGQAPAASPDANDYSAIYGCELNVQVETASTNGPYTIYFGTPASNTILGCRGIMDFRQGAGSFTGSNVNPATSAESFWYTGIIAGDGNLMPANSWPLEASTVGKAYAESFMSGSNGNVFTQSGDFFKATLSADITINLAPTGQGAVAPCPQRKTLVITQAASGGPYTVTWPQPGSPSVSSPAIYWAGGGSAPVMSTAASAVDVYKLESYDGVHWYGTAIQAAPAPVSGQYLCAPSSYAPGTETTLSVISTIFAQFGLSTTVAAGSNGGEISAIASWASPSAGVLDVASATGFPTSGTLNIAASGSTVAIVTYTGISGNSFTGCAYVSGAATATVATGGEITVTSVANISTGDFTAPPSGDVVVGVSFVGESTSGDFCALALAESGSVTPLSNVVEYQDSASAAPRPYYVQFLVTGLTAYSTYDLVLLGAGTSGVLSSILAYGQSAATPATTRGAPVIMTVQAV